MRKHTFYKGRALDSELRSIYEERGKLPDMTRLEHEYHRRTTRILLGLVLFFGILTAASWGGFFLYGPKSGGGKEVALTIKAPEAVVSGVEQTITIHYQNTDRNPLAIATLTLRPTKNLIIKTTEPLPEQEGRLRFNLGTLKAKEEGDITLTVIPYGTIDQRLELQAIASYKPANFNAEFQTSISHEFIIRAEGVAVTLKGPETTSPGRKVELIAKIENKTDTPIQKVRAILTSPGGFVIQSTTPSSDSAKWDLGTINPGQTKEIAIKGTFVTSAKGSQEISIAVEEETTTQSFPLAKSTLQIEVEGSDLAVELTVNNTPGLTWVRLGQSLQYLLKVSNNSTKMLEDITASLRIDSSLVDLKSIQTESGTIEGSKISFPKTGSFTLTPKETKEFIVTVNALRTAQPSTSPYIEANAQVNIGTTTFTGIPLKVIVVSDLALTVEGRYFGSDGKPIGSGPIPPKVGEETVYEVRVRLRNTFHDLSTISVISTLPKGVRFITGTSEQAGKISSNEKTKEVLWEISRMPVTTSEIGATFKIAVTPEAGDLGQLIGLVGITRAEAFDTISQIQFSTDAPSVSSNLDGDPFGRGKGVVQ
ncbi:MAG: hypothetical protein Q7S48_04190 [bacterium]|nr:hypothetical protein [bacterium]